MQILCAIGVRRGAELVRRAAERIGAPADYVLVHVIDVGPRRGMQQVRERFRPPPHHPPPPTPPHERESDEAEQASGEESLHEALDAAQALGLHVETRLERGEPEHVVVQIAQQLNADLIVVHAHERGGQPAQGPGSVGHSTRFILDHAPCDVLLLRGP
jgi:nucleotide-binding universal stress UspA family protein